jgi:hypothetical protein
LGLWKFQIFLRCFKTIKIIKKMYWIIKNYKNDGFDNFEPAIKKLGYTLIKLSDNYDLNQLIDICKFPHIFLGPIETMNILKSQLINYNPIIFCTWDNYLCSKYYAHFGKYLLNNIYTILPLNELQRLKFFIYGNYGIDGYIFIRPDCGKKPFIAQVLDFKDIDYFIESNDESKHELVIISTPKTINWEGRFIVSNAGEIISYSTYKFQDQYIKVPSVPEKSIEFVKELLKTNYHPDPVFCIDICEDSNNKFHLLELTSFSSAGLYESKKDVIISEVSKICQKIHNSR